MDSKSTDKTSTLEEDPDQDCEVSGESSPKVPDGGWGWVCVSACAVMMLLQQGFSISFSLVFLAIRDRFQSSAAATAWVYGIYQTTNRMAGPLSGALCKRFGVQRCVVVAAVVKSASLILTGYAPSLPFLYLWLGLFGGCAGSVMLTSTFIVINQYFDKKRSKATAVALMGRGVGVLIFAPLVAFLLEEYGYRGAMLILGGCFLNVVPVGLLLKPPMIANTVDPEACHREVTKKEPQKLNEAEVLDVQDSRCRVIEDSKGLVTGESPSSNNATESDAETDRETSLETKSSFHHHCSCCHSTTIRTCIPASTQKTRTVFSKLVDFFDLHLLKQPPFLAYTLHVVFVVTAGSVCNLYAAALGQEVGVEGNTMALTLSLFGAITIITRLISGFVFDNRRVRPHRIHLYSAILLLTAALLLFTMLIHNFTTFLLVVLGFGALFSVVTTQDTVILADLVNKRTFPNAVGLSLAFRGLGMLIGAPLSGLLEDKTGSFVSCYLLASGFFALGFLVIEPHHLYSRICGRKGDSGQEASSEEVERERDIFRKSEAGT